MGLKWLESFNAERNELRRWSKRELESVFGEGRRWGHCGPEGPRVWGGVKGGGGGCTPAFLGPQCGAARPAGCTDG